MRGNRSEFAELRNLPLALIGLLLDANTLQRIHIFLIVITKIFYVNYEHLERLTLVLTPYALHVILDMFTSTFTS